MKEITVNRKDRYKEYTGKLFRYSYPFTWKKRSKNYLETLPDRDYEEEQDCIFPSKEKDCRMNK